MDTLYKYFGNLISNHRFIFGGDLDAAKEAGQKAQEAAKEKTEAEQAQQEAAEAGTPESEKEFRSETTATEREGKDAENKSKKNTENLWEEVDTGEESYDSKMQANKKESQKALSKKIKTGDVESITEDLASEYQANEVAALERYGLGITSNIKSPYDFANAVISSAKSQKATRRPSKFKSDPEASAIAKTLAPDVQTIFNRIGKGKDIGPNAFKNRLAKFEKKGVVDPNAKAAVDAWKSLQGEAVPTATTDTTQVAQAETPGKGLRGAAEEMDREEGKVPEGEEIVAQLTKQQEKAILGLGVSLYANLDAGGHVNYAMEQAGLGYSPSTIRIKFYELMGQVSFDNLEDFGRQIAKECNAIAQQAYQARNNNDKKGLDRVVASVVSLKDKIENYKG